MFEALIDHPPHALLLTGPRGTGKAQAAERFARTLLKSEKKTPPDLRQLYPEGKANLHSMQAIKAFIEDTSLPPFEAPYKVFLIHDADRMLPSSANALLKTLEEPPPGIVIVLITSQPQLLLPTIISRCFLVPFSLTSEKNFPLAEEMFALGLRLLNKDLPSQKELPEIPHIDEALSYLFYFFRDLHLLRTGADPSLLFYYEKQETLSTITGPIPSLEDIQAKIERLLLAAEVNLPLSHALALLV